jgi:hypothetical protein
MKPVSLISSLVCAAIACTPALAQNPFPALAKSNATEATNNARQIGLMLIEFETDYGLFPSEKTLADVEENSGVKLPAGDKSSNTLFRQLFAAGITVTEAPFFANIPGAMRGGDQNDPGKALAKGKNGFAYIAGLNTAGNPARPLVVCPLIPGTTKFDPKPFGGKAIILRCDLSVQALPIEEDGTVLVDGVELLSKDHPVWKGMEGKAPDIRHADLAADA